MLSSEEMKFVKFSGWNCRGVSEKGNRYEISPSSPEGKIASGCKKLWIVWQFLDVVSFRSEGVICLRDGNVDRKKIDCSGKKQNESFTATA